MRWLSNRQTTVEKKETTRTGVFDIVQKSGIQYDTGMKKEATELRMMLAVSFKYFPKILYQLSDYCENILSAVSQAFRVRKDILFGFCKLHFISYDYMLFICIHCHLYSSVLYCVKHYPMLRTSPRGVQTFQLSIVQVHMKISIYWELLDQSSAPLIDSSYVS